MKFQSFYNEAKKLVQENTQIHLPTFKQFITLFYSFLSPTEKERWKYETNVITSFTTVQQTIDQNRNMLRTKQLSKELQKLKGNKVNNRRHDIT